MRRLAVAILISLLSAIEAQAVELFRYRLTMPGGREFEYVFETEERGVPETIAISREELYPATAKTNPMT